MEKNVTFHYKGKVLRTIFPLNGEVWVCLRDYLGAIGASPSGAVAFRNREANAKLNIKQLNVSPGKKVDFINADDINKLSFKHSTESYDMSGVSDFIIFVVTPHRTRPQTLSAGMPENSLPPADQDLKGEPKSLFTETETLEKSVDLEEVVDEGVSEPVVSVPVDGTKARIDELETRFAALEDKIESLLQGSYQFVPRQQLPA